MDIYTECAEWNLIYLFKKVFCNYMNQHYGIHSLYLYKENEFYNTDALLDYIFKNDQYWLEFIIDQLAYYYIFKVIEHFIDMCPFDICVKNQYNTNRSIKSS